MSARPSANSTDELLTRREAADLLGVESGTLARWLSCGRGNDTEDRGPACVRDERGRILYRYSDVIAWAKERGLWVPASRSGRPVLGRSGRPALGRPSLGRGARRRPSTRANEAPEFTEEVDGHYPPRRLPSPQVAPQHQAPRVAPPQAAQAPSTVQTPTVQLQAELERVRAELEQSQADADQLRLELEKIQAGGEAEQRGEELRQAEQIMLHCLEKQLRSNTPLRVSKVVQDGEAIERDYIVSAGGGRSKLWAVACPECGHHVGSGKEYLGLTGGLAGEYTCGKCAARLLVAETSSPYVLPSGRATAVPTVSVLSLKPAKRDAK